MPSVLDRLIDDQPRVSTEPDWARGRHLAQVKESVKRDLEWLLNSKRSAGAMPPGLPHLLSSPLAYGLPDITSASLSNDHDRAQLRRALEDAVSRFEPRLTRVRVTLEEGREMERTVRFRIDAMLDVDPAPLPVTFDSMLKLNTRSFVVQGT